MSENRAQKGMRTCIGCGAKRPKTQMLRVVAAPEGPQLDPTGRVAGRGAYGCSAACLQAALQKNKLGRALRMRVEADRVRALASDLEQASDDAVAR